MTPPFLGTSVIDQLALDDIVPLIDLEQLFAARWQYRQGMESAAWESFKLKQCVPLLERMLALCRLHDVITPKIVYGYFRCCSDGSALIVEGERKSYRFDFPRERAAPNRSLADFFPEGIAAFQLATVGEGASREGARLFKANAYSDTFFLKGLAAEAAEATAAWAHRRIREELSVAADAGCRFSPGYPAFPSLFDQRKIAQLLLPARIGIKLTKTCQLIPEHSTAAIVSVDPRARHFRP